MHSLITQIRLQIITNLPIVTEQPLRHISLHLFKLSVIELEFEVFFFYWDQILNHQIKFSVCCQLDLNRHIFKIHLGYPFLKRLFAKTQISWDFFFHLEIRLEFEGRAYCRWSTGSSNNRTDFIGREDYCEAMIPLFGRGNSQGFIYIISHLISAIYTDSICF